MMDRQVVQSELLSSVAGGVDRLRAYWVGKGAGLIK